MNPELWDPHRWDTNPYIYEENKSLKVDYGYGLVSAAAKTPYLPFRAGQHGCVGEKFTYPQFVAVMVREFELRNLEGHKGVEATGFSVSIRYGPWRMSLVHHSQWLPAQWLQQKFGGKEGAKLPLNLRIV